MKKMIYKAVAFCLSFGLAFSSTCPVFASETAIYATEEDDFLDGVETKFYENIYDDDGDGIKETGELSYICPEQAFESYEDSVQKLGEYLRKFFLHREENDEYFAVVVPISFPSDSITNVNTLISQYKRDIPGVLYAETSNPDEGQMMFSEIKATAGVWVNSFKNVNGNCSATFIYRAQHMHTEEEYNAYKAKVTEVLSSLDLSNKTETEKLFELHKYVRNEVKYASTGTPINGNVITDDQSAYSALIEGGAVCAGKARLFQYFSLSVGIPCYYIQGYLLGTDGVADLVDAGKYIEEEKTFDMGNTGINHAWNVVKIGNIYYHTDPTNGEFLFALNGEKSSIAYNYNYYPSHVVADKDKIKDFFISDVDYNTSDLSCTHTNTEIRDKKDASCSEEGYTGNTYCTDCENVIAAGTVIPKTDHAFGEGVVTKEATCTEPGEITYTCAVCSETKTEPIPATGHKNTVLRGQMPAGCEEEGYTGDTYCTDCKTIIQTGESIPATGHQRTEVRGAKAPTCEEDGYTGDTYCTDCEKMIKQGETIAATGHSYDEGIITKEPDCTNTGIKTYTCESCDKTKTETIAALGHSYDEGVVTKEPTCTEEGEKQFTCTRCQDTRVETLPVDASKHTWGTSITYTWDGDTCTAERVCVNNPEHKDKISLTVKAESEDATCTTPGTIIYTATGTFSDGTKASDIKTVTGEALGHDYKTVVTPPTCQTDGYTTYTCSRCGDTYTSDRVEALPHAYDEPTFIINEEKALFKCSACGYARKVDADIRTEVKKEATCSEEGILSYTASVEFEGKTYSKEGEQVIEKLPHTNAIMKGYAPTCTKDGLTDGVKCSVCKEVLTKQEVIPATGHQNTEIRNARAATCQKEGYTGDTYCKDCGEKISSGTTIAKTAHTWDTGRVTKAATYDTEGVRTYTCTACGSARTESIPRLTRPEVKVQRIAISALSNKVAVKKKMKLTAEAFPANAADKRITWTSSNPKVATVNQSGVVTVKKKGSAVITATAASGVKASYKIKGMKGVVKKVAISGVKPVKAGKALKLKAKVTATKGSNTKLTWSSSNENYAKVSASGKVKTTAAGKGKKVKITAMATDGSNKKKTVTIKIK